MSSAGYSGTPLWKKLGFKEGMSCAFIHPPNNLDELLLGVPAYVEAETEGMDMVLFFTNQKQELTDGLKHLQDEIARNGAIWVCWYKKASKKATEVDEGLIRETALKLDLVDVKVCAVDSNWSGLKLMIRKELR